MGEVSLVIEVLRSFMTTVQQLTVTALAHLGQIGIQAPPQSPSVASSSSSGKSNTDSSSSSDSDTSVPATPAKDEASRDSLESGEIPASGIVASQRPASSNSSLESGEIPYGALTPGWDSPPPTQPSRPTSPLPVEDWFNQLVNEAVAEVRESPNQSKCPFGFSYTSPHKSRVVRSVPVVADNRTADDLMTSEDQQPLSVPDSWSTRFPFEPTRETIKKKLEFDFDDLKTYQPLVSPVSAVASPMSDQCSGLTFLVQAAEKLDERTPKALVQYGGGAEGTKSDEKTMPTKRKRTGDDDKYAGGAEGTKSDEKTTTTKRKRTDDDENKENYRNKKLVGYDSSSDDGVFSAFELKRIGGGRGGGGGASVKPTRVSLARRRAEADRQRTLMEAEVKRLDQRLCQSPLRESQNDGWSSQFNIPFSKRD